MSFVDWLKQSPFATPWFDALLFGVLLFELLPFFLRARAARMGFAAASVACQLALLISCLYLGTTLTETLLVLGVAVLFSAVSSFVEYRVFDRAAVTAEREGKAAEAKRTAEERAALFVLPQNGEAPTESEKEGDQE